MGTPNKPAVFPCKKKAGLCPNTPCYLNRIECVMSFSPPHPSYQRPALARQLDAERRRKAVRADRVLLPPLIFDAVALHLRPLRERDPVIGRAERRNNYKIRPNEPKSAGVRPAIRFSFK